MSKDHPEGTLTEHFTLRPKPKKNDAEEQTPAPADGETLVDRKG